MRLSSFVAAAALLVGLSGGQPAAAQSGGLRGDVSAVALDPDGVTPESVGLTTNVIAGSGGNFLAFTYTQGLLPSLPGVEVLSIDIPAVWGGSTFDDAVFSADPERYETPGYVRVKPGTCASAGQPEVLPARSGDGWTVTLAEVDCAPRQSLSIELFYVTAPGEPGRYSFPTRLHGLPVRSDNAPSLKVHPVPDVALVLSEVPATVEQGEAFGVRLTAVGDNGKVRRGYRGTVRFVGNCDDDGPADYTFTGADRGTHLFTDIVLRTVGEHTFGFRDVGNLARPAEAVTTVRGVPDPSECGVHYH